MEREAYITARGGAAGGIAVDDGGAEEIDALVTVMDAVKDTYQMQPLTDDQKAEIEIDGQ